MGLPSTPGTETETLSSQRPSSALEAEPPAYPGKIGHSRPAPAAEVCLGFPPQDPQQAGYQLSAQHLPGCGCRLRPAIYFPGGRGPGKPEEGKRPAVAAPTRWLSMARPDSSGGGGPWTDRWGPKSRPSILRGSAAVSFPTRPAGLLQWDLKVRLRCSPSVLGWRVLLGAHGGGQRGLLSTTGPQPVVHEPPAVSPLWAADRRC